MTDAKKPSKLKLPEKTEEEKLAAAESRRAPVRAAGVLKTRATPESKKAAAAETPRRRPATQRDDTPTRSRSNDERQDRPARARTDDSRAPRRNDSLRTDAPRPRAARSDEPARSPRTPREQDGRRDAGSFAARDEGRPAPRRGFDERAPSGDRSGRPAGPRREDSNRGARDGNFNRDDRPAPRGERPANPRHDDSRSSERRYPDERPQRPRYSDERDSGRAPERSANRPPPEYAERPRRTQGADGVVSRHPPLPPRFNDKEPTRTARAKPGAARIEAPSIRSRSATSESGGEVRLSKRMTELGLCSRREADDYIERGWVKVDGVVVDVLGSKVLPNQRIELERIAEVTQNQRVTVILNKPIGFVSGQAEDGYEPASVLITPEQHWEEDPTRRRFETRHMRKLAPAGRLDIDSTGLLVLTQDGRIAKQLIGEDSDIEKEYLVRVEGNLSAKGMKLLQHGLMLDGVELQPAKVSWQNEDQLRFVLREGRKRQIRRMCELVGLHVVGLKRIRIGQITLSKLPLGQWRYLGDMEKF